MASAWTAGRVSPLAAPAYTGISGFPIAVNCLLYQLDFFSCYSTPWFYDPCLEVILRNGMEETDD